MKFRISQLPYDGHYEVYSPELLEVRVKFPDTELGRAMAGDYVDFLNDKYCDKEVNKEWPKIDRMARIKYHLEQISILIDSDKIFWGEHGNEVKKGSG